MEARRIEFPDGKTRLEAHPGHETHEFESRLAFAVTKSARGTSLPYEINLKELGATRHHHMWKALDRRVGMPTYHVKHASRSMFWFQNAFRVVGTRNKLI